MADPAILRGRELPKTLAAEHVLDQFLSVSAKNATTAITFWQILMEVAE